MSPQNPTSRRLGCEIKKGCNVPGAVRPFVYEIVSVLTTKLVCEFKGYFTSTYKSVFVWQDVFMVVNEGQLVVHSVTFNVTHND